MFGPMGIRIYTLSSNSRTCFYSDDGSFILISHTRGLKSCVQDASALLATLKSKKVARAAPYAVPRESEMALCFI